MRQTDTLFASHVIVGWLPRLQSIFDHEVVMHSVFRLQHCIGSKDTRGGIERLIKLGDHGKTMGPAEGVTIFPLSGLVTQRDFG